MNLKLLMIYYGVAMLPIIILIVILIVFHVKKKKNDIFDESIVKTDEERAKQEKERRNQTIIITFCMVILVLCAIILTLPAMLDLPHVVSNNYEYIDGTVVNVEEGGGIGGDAVTIKDAVSKEQIEITSTHGICEEGDDVEAYYLPHMEIGTIKLKDYDIFSNYLEDQEETSGMHIPKAFSDTKWSFIIAIVCYVIGFALVRRGNPLGKKEDDFQKKRGKICLYVGIIISDIGFMLLLLTILKLKG